MCQISLNNGDDDDYYHYHDDDKADGCVDDDDDINHNSVDQLHFFSSFLISFFLLCSRGKNLHVKLLRPLNMHISDVLQ